MIVRSTAEGRYDGSRETPQRALWRAVISQAIADATLSGASRKAARERDRARAWFNLANGDFREVCECADVEPDKVVALMQRKIEESDRQPRMHHGKPITINGECKTPEEWAVHIGISTQVFLRRVSKGLPPDMLLAKSLRSYPRARLVGVHQSELTCATPGVVADFRHTEGTGGGRFALDLHELGDFKR